MLELQTIVKRQIEIVGIAVHNPLALKVPDIAVEFNCDDLTIKRDMQALRSHGIPVHSTKKRGLCIDGKVDPVLLRELIVQYLGICGTANAVDKATALLVKMKREMALYHIVTLQRCIEQTHTARIDYQKDREVEEKDREIGPLAIFSSEGYWRVLALNEGKVKQYHVNKLLNVRPTSNRFKPVPREQIDDMFRYSFKSWVGADQHHVKIRLSKTWADRLRPRQMMETQVVTEHPDGSVEFEATVNSLDEIASWVVSRGKGVVVVEPDELKRKVMDLAQGALGNY